MDFNIKLNQNRKNYDENFEIQFAGQEKYMIERFANEMTHVEKLIREKMVWRGLVNSTAESIPLFIFAGAMYYGAYLVAIGEIHFKNFIKLVENAFERWFCD